MRLGLLFGAFMVLQLVVLRMANRAGSGFLPQPQQELVYLFLQVAVIGGFLLHAALRRRALTAAALGTALTGAAVMLFAPCDAPWYLLVTGVTTLTLGFTGGAVYTRLALYAVGERHAGRSLGIGYAAAVALQYGLQLQWEIKPALLLLLLLACGVTGVLLSDSHAAPSAEEEQPVSRFALVAPAVITLALLLFTSYYNSYIHHLQIASGYTDFNVYSLPRLLMIPTVMLLGTVADLRGGRLLPVCTLCVVSLALLNTALLGRETYLLNMCLYYVALTAVVVYYHLTFLRLAPRTKHPALWACMGRLLDSAAVILSFGFRFSQLSQVAVLLIDIAALAVVVVMMAVSGSFNLTVPRKQAAPDPFLSAQARYGITPSELRVLRELVQTDDKQEVVAARLQISVSTLRHHITSLYKKTGAQTRAALCKLISQQAQPH